LGKVELGKQRPVKFSKHIPRAKLYKYRRQKCRQRRITLLVIGVTVVALFSMIGVSALALWLGNNVGKPIENTFSPRSMMADVPLNMMPLLDPYNLEVPSLANNLEGFPQLLTGEPSPSFNTGVLDELTPPLMPVPLLEEDTELKETLQSLISQYSTEYYKTHLYFFNPQTGQYINISGTSPVQSASVIKLPILYDYLLSLESRFLSSSDNILYGTHHKASGSGSLQYQDAGSLLSIDSVARDMIRVSDNTCTNMMIESLGGMTHLNHRWQALGLKQTFLRQVLPDLEGTNTVSAYEMLTVLYNIDEGKHLSESIRAYGLDILKETRNRGLLAWNMPKTVEIAHKTGNIDSVLGDVAIFYLPDGRRYFLTMLVERPENDNTPTSLFHQISQTVYEKMITEPEPVVNNQADEVPLDETTDSDPGNNESGEN
jgi:beta-lactamase class A